MKQIFYVILTAGLLIASVACTRPRDPLSALESAELAYANGRYSGAQKLCDSLVLGNKFTTLNTQQLCRLSLLLVRLAENYGNEEANTVFAARTLQAASQKAPDSMVAFLSNVPVEDQARLALISAINEGLNRPEGSDSSLIEEPDTTFESY